MADIAVNRRAFLGLCRASNALTAGCVARHARIDPEWVRTTMLAKGKATYLHSVGGGDETITFTAWSVPTVNGDLVLVMPMTHHRLWRLERETTP